MNQGYCNSETILITDCGDTTEFINKVFGYKIFQLLFGENENLLTQHISGILTKYKLLYVSNQGRIGAWVRAIDIVIC